MKVGDVVALKWVDSGMGFRGAKLSDVLAADLSRPTVYGEVMFLDADHVVIAQELDEAGAYGDFGLYWVPAIDSVRILLPATDVVEVEAQTEAPTKAAAGCKCGPCLSESPGCCVFGQPFPCIWG